MEKINLIWKELTPLEEFNINALGKISGVYRLSYLHKDGNKYVFYVGQTDDIMGSLLKHRKSEDKHCIKSYIDSTKCFFRYAPVETDIREKVFNQLYKFYQPLCNDPIPVDNDDIQINVT